MPDEKQWLHEFFAEVERLFDGKLPSSFNIERITYDPKMSPLSAARDYYVGYNMIHQHAK